MNPAPHKKRTVLTWNGGPRILPALLILLACTVVPVAAAGAASCPGCGMIWKDTCVPFERNNETAYNEELTAAFAPVAANKTPPADYSNLSWSEAFRSLHILIKERYAFTQWRAVDFDALYTTWAPAIAAAEKEQDEAAYYRALRGYLVAVPDGHVEVLDTNGDFGAKYADIGGGYGIAVVRLDSGKVIVSYVANGSAAEAAGVRPGDEVTGWNGMEVHEAINATSSLWAVKKPSTAEGLLLQKSRLLTRAPVGTPASVKITYGAIQHPRIMNLTAYDDGYDSLKKSSFFLGKEVNDIGAVNRLTDIQPQVSNDTLTYRTLPGGYAYIAIYNEAYDVYGPFRAAMLDADTKNAPGVVVDLRYNSGGDDNLASCFAGWFVDEPVFYEYATTFDPGSRQFTAVSEAWTQPQPARYTGPVAVLVSPDTISSGEGLPMVFAKTGTGKVISWYGSNGAFGMNGPQAVLPLGMYVFFPDGASLGQDGVVQVDSNASLTGGVAPQVRVPLTEETVTRAMAGEDVQLTYAREWLDGQQVPAATATTPKASPSVAVVVVAVGTFVLARARK
ncbi:MAG: S41 family peptidase [Methanoregula sp.]|nr:S41 family peptidase [Methanoregula sp.]